MKVNKREYIGHGIVALEEISASQSVDRDLLLGLAHELGFRKTARAARLRNLIEQRLSKLELDCADGESAARTALRGKDHLRLVEATARTQSSSCPPPATGSAEPEKSGRGPDLDCDLPPDDRRRPATFSGMSSPGVAGKPEAYEPALKQDLRLPLPVNATRARRYVQALEALLAEIRKDGKGQRRYELKDGKLVEAQTEQPIYCFPLIDNAELFEEARVEIEADGRRRSGQIVSICDGKLMVALDDHLGLSIRRCVLLVDNTALIELLKDRLIQADEGALQLSLALADSVVDRRNETPIIVSNVETPEVGNLNICQTEAAKTMLKHSVSYLWGPPGTGKTQTLAVVVQALFDADKRVLICSNTNQAVDQLLLKVCKHLTSEHSALQDGRVVRVGAPTLSDLSGKWSPFVTLNGIIDRLSHDLKERQGQLENRIAELDERAAPVIRDLQNFERLDEIRKDAGELARRLAERSSAGKATIAARDRAQRRVEQWGNEHNELKAAGAIRRAFMRSEDRILADVRRATADAERQNDLARSISRKLAC